MIGFRSETETYADAATRIASGFETTTESGHCRVCGESDDDCTRYKTWCIGRTARQTKDNPGWREQFEEQLALVMRLGPFDW